MTRITHTNTSSGCERASQPHPNILPSREGYFLARLLSAPNLSLLKARRRRNRPTARLINKHTDCLHGNPAPNNNLVLL
jgi:hypothetical protein